MLFVRHACEGSEPASQRDRVKTKSTRSHAVVVIASAGLRSRSPGRAVAWAPGGVATQCRAPEKRVQEAHVPSTSPSRPGVPNKKPLRMQGLSSSGASETPIELFVRALQETRPEVLRIAGVTVGYSQTRLVSVTSEASAQE